MYLIDLYWEKDVSEFLWTYDEVDDCYFSAIDIVVASYGSEPAKMGKGDFVTFLVERLALRRLIEKLIIFTAKKLLNGQKPFLG